MIKVMIADDQELIRQSLQIVLEMKEGIEVTATAKDGREVIQEVRKDKPDVILMDVRMPEMDGVQMYTDHQRTISRCQDHYFDNVR